MNEGEERERESNKEENKGCGYSIFKYCNWICVFKPKTNPIGQPIDPTLSYPGFLYFILVWVTIRMDQKNDPRDSHCTLVGPHILRFLSSPMRL